MTKSRSRKAADLVAKADTDAATALGQYRDRLPVRAWSKIAKLGDQPELRTISAAVFAAGLLLGRKRLIRAGIRMLIAHELATSAKDFVKTRIDRTRPHKARGAKQAKPKPGRHTAKARTSFPSGHSAGSVAVAQAFARQFPDHRAAALGVAGVIAAGQIPKGAHYPSDIAAGSFLGLASEAMLGKLWPASSADRDDEESG